MLCFQPANLAEPGGHGVHRFTLDPSLGEFVHIQVLRLLCECFIVVRVPTVEVHVGVMKQT